MKYSAVITQINALIARIAYKLMSLTSSLPASPPISCGLISVQPLRSTRSSSVVTISRPPTSSSLKSILTAPFDIQQPTPGTIFLNHSASLIPIIQSLPHSLTSLVMPDHRPDKRLHSHHLSPFFSFTPESKYTFFTNHTHHSSNHRSPLDGLHGYPAR